MTDDLKFLEGCFRLAKKGTGYVSPNPFVGAILVKDDKMIGRGWHKKIGEAHAEVNAINNSIVDVSGSTLYCNLEPCCHTNKKTLPCVPLIIQKKIKRVVISNIDPNKDVNGKGVEQLRAAGIEVITGIMEDEGKELNKFYFKYIKGNEPYITLKIAQSIDGKISLNRKKQTWLTGLESKRYVHRLRSEYDAVLVGAGTIISDNPLLTVRDVKGRNPFRIIIDGKLKIPLNSKVIESADPQKTIILTSVLSSKRKKEQLREKGARLFELQTNKQNKISINSILKILSDYKFTSLLVEGGREIFTQFIEANLFDELIVLQSNIVMGNGIGAFNTKKVNTIKLKYIERIGNDLKLIYGKKFANQIMNKNN